MRYERLILGSILALILILLCYNYATNEYYHTKTLFLEDAIDNSGNYNFIQVKNYVFIMGTVTEVYDTEFNIKVSKNKNVDYYNVKRLSNLDFILDTDYPIIIFGTMDSPTQVNAIKIITKWEGDTIFLIFRSLFGLILFLVIFSKYWRFNAKKIIFMRKK